MGAYETAQSIALVALVALGLFGLTGWFLIVATAMIITAGLHELILPDEE